MATPASTETIATHHPDVAGRCPACGSNGTLFLGSGGYVTCSVSYCPNPSAAADLLLPTPATVTEQVEVKPGDVVESRAAGDRCRGPVTSARPDDPYAWMWCQGCKCAHVLQNPLHRFWRIADRED